MLTFILKNKNKKRWTQEKPKIKDKGKQMNNNNNKGELDREVEPAQCNTMEPKDNVAEVKNWLE